MTAKTEERKAISNEIESTLDQAQNVVRQMEYKLSQMRDAKDLTMLKQRVKNYDQDIQRHRHSLLVAVPASGVSSLDSGAFSDTYRRAEESNQRLINTERAAYESEEVGASVATKLRGQREQLERTNDRLTDMDDTMSGARGKLRRLGVRVMGDKIILWIIIVVESLTLFFMIFGKFVIPYIINHRHHDNKSSGSP